MQSNFSRSSDHSKIAKNFADNDENLPPIFLPEMTWQQVPNEAGILHRSHFFPAFSSTPIALFFFTSSRITSNSVHTSIKLKSRRINRPITPRNKRFHPYSLLHCTIAITEEFELRLKLYVRHIFSTFSGFSIIFVKVSVLRLLPNRLYFTLKAFLVAVLVYLSSDQDLMHNT